MTTTYVERIRPKLPIVALVVLAPLVGVLTAVAPTLGAVAALALVAALVACCLTGETAVRRTTLLLCAVIIAYPAFTPRRAAGYTTVVDGGDFGGRAQFQLIVVVGVAAAAAWLWLTTPGTISALRRLPLSLFALYAGLITVSLAYTPDTRWAAFAALKLFEAFLLVGVLAVVVHTPDQLRRVVDIMLLACGVVMLVYLGDLAAGAALGTSSARARNTWIHPNNISLICFTFASITAARFFTARDRRSMRLGGGLMAFGIFAGLMTAGKSGIVAGTVAILLALGISLLRLGLPRIGGRMLLLVISVLLIGSAIVAANVGIARHWATYTESENGELGTLTGRLPLWQVVYERGMEQPIRGHGYMSTFESDLDNELFWVASQAHNAFLQSFFDLGVPGFLVVVAIFVTALGSAIRQVFTLPVRDVRWPISLSLTAALTALTINSFTEDVFGGLFEIRTMLFVIVVFAIFQNTRVRETAALPAREARPQLASLDELAVLSARNRGN